MAVKKKSRARKKSGNKGLVLQKAVKRPGRMTAWCKKHGFSGPSCTCLKRAKAEAQRRGDRSLLSAAVLGMRLKKCAGYALEKKGKRKK